MPEDFDDLFFSPDEDDEDGSEEQKRTKTKLSSNRIILRAALKIIDRKFPRMADCREECARRGFKHRNPVCNECGHSNFKRKYGSLSGKCLNCKKVQSLVPDTIFYNAKKLRAVLSMLILLEEGFVFNSAQFSEERKLGKSSGWAMRIKISAAISKHLEEHKHIIEIESKKFAPVVTRRSRVTPAGKHPTSEEAAMQRQNHSNANTENSEEGAPEPDENKESPSSDNSENDTKQTTTALTVADTQEGQSELEKRILAAMTSEPIGLDELLDLIDEPIGKIMSALTILELNEKIVARAGGRFALAEETNKPQQNLKGVSGVNRATSLTPTDINNSALLQAGMDYIKSTFQGVSRKYLQLYIADYWRVAAHTAGKIPFSIFEACCSALETSRDEIRAYISPLKIKMAVPSTA